MFNAARAGLLNLVDNAKPDGKYSHSGLLRAFSEHLVMTGVVAKDLGRTLNRMFDLRLAADYAGGQVSYPDAETAVEHAQVFVAAIQVVMIPEEEDGDQGEDGQGMAPVDCRQSTGSLPTDYRHRPGRGLVSGVPQEAWRYSSARSMMLSMTTPSGYWGGVG